MHKIFYASGFIYHLPSQQILLQKSHPATSLWVLFEKGYTGYEQPEIIFKDTILNLLGIEIDSINPVYSYLNETTRINHTLLYAVIEDLQDFPRKNDHVFRWFSFKEVIKIQATIQTKHDIVVGQRVIEAAERKKRGEHTFE